MLTICYPFLLFEAITKPVPLVQVQVRVGSRGTRTIPPYQQQHKMK